MSDCKKVKIDPFISDMMKFRASDDLKERIFCAATDMTACNRNHKQSGRSTLRNLRVLQSKYIIVLFACLVIGSVFLFSGVLDNITFSGCPPIFADRYVSLIELNDVAYVYQGNGILYSVSTSGDQQKITSLSAEELKTDGEAFFYSKGNYIFRFKPEGGKQKVFGEKYDITLDYVDSSHMIYHFGNHDRYSVYDRNTGEKKELFDISEEKYYTFHAASGDNVVFVFSNKGQDALYTINIFNGHKTKIFDGAIRNRVVIIDDIVYFSQTGMTEDKTRYMADELWSVNLNGNELRQLDLSEIPLENIQAIAGSGRNLLITTDEQYLRHHGKIYLYQTDAGKFSILQSEIGLIDRLFATENYYSYYDKGTTDEKGKAFVGLVDY
ncbi:MAG: hypothetical protein SCM11_08295 [Bacillota bacterium]|nr:hypothetical protein [Bacillota bacterium]